MSHWSVLKKILRIALIVVAVLVGLFLVADYGFKLWLKANADTIAAERDAAAAGGTELGETTDNAGCLTAALARAEDCDGLACAVGNSTFLGDCLNASQPTPGFCDSVPPSTFMGNASEAKTRLVELHCGDGSWLGDKECRYVIMGLQHFCHPEDQ